jgi:hypothetical protein
MGRQAKTVEPKKSLFDNPDHFVVRSGGLVDSTRSGKVDTTRPFRGFWSSGCGDRKIEISAATAETFKRSRAADSDF